MRLSAYFLPTLKETPSDEQIVSHQLMVRAGLIRQASAGIYSWLPLGLRVLRRIETIVREEQDRAGALELLMPTVQSADLWRESGRYDAYGKEMLRIVDRHERDLLYGPTNEELITDIFRAFVKSAKDLPLNLYHIQWKFRDEIRPRFGVMRGREFLMKDAYSFDLDPVAARASYNRMFLAYLRTFARMGLQAVPMAADTGPIGGDMSHEFIILAETGESAVFCDRQLIDIGVPESIDYASDLQGLVDQRTALYAATDEKHDEAAFNASVPAERQVSARGIEVGHIFFFGTKYSTAMNAVVQNAANESVPVQMGSYGIGVSRLVGALIEAHHDDRGIVWPAAVAPFTVGLINIKRGDGASDAACEEAYRILQNAGIDVLYDDRDERAGTKFSTMDLIGLPFQLLIGPKGLAAGEVEVKIRSSGERESLSLEAALAKLIETARRDHGEI
ncbi:MAG: proline--tRNA ligase [Pseudomonadota bacterium]